MIIIDTQILIWWATKGSKLSINAKKTIQASIRKEEKILISTISVWEVFLLVKTRKLILNTHPDIWIRKIEKLPYFHFIPIDNIIAAKSVMLPGFSHKDPADRIIVATALEYEATLVTSDRKLLNYKRVKSLW